MRSLASHPLAFDVTFLHSTIYGVRQHQMIGFDPKIAALGEDVIVRAVRGEAIASGVIGRFLLWHLDDPLGARPYLERAARTGSFEALADLAVVLMFAPAK